MRAKFKLDTNTKVIRMWVLCETRHFIYTVTPVTSIQDTMTPPLWVLHGSPLLNTVTEPHQKRESESAWKSDALNHDTNNRNADLALESSTLHHESHQ